MSAAPDKDSKAVNASCHCCPARLLTELALSLPIKLSVRWCFARAVCDQILILSAWHEAMESRPPLRIDMSGPSPTTYSPRNKPLYETNAPAFSFGRKETEKG